MLRKLLFYLINLVGLIITSVSPLVGALNANALMAGNICPSSVIDKIMQFIRPNEEIQEVESLERFKVYVSGKPIGFQVEGGGVVVVTMGEVKTENGYVKSPCEDAGVEVGDVIIKASGEDVTSGERLIDIINSRQGQTCTLQLLRNGTEISVDVTPLFDNYALSYRLGVWVRDNAVGVGTVTYVTEDNCFSALGHPIADSDTSTIFPVGVGKIYKCSVIGVRKGERGKPGELKGLFLKNSNEIGMIQKNTTKGISGKLTSSEAISSFKTGGLTEVALRKEVKPGSATIYTTIDGNEPRYYDIEIIKTNHVNSYGNKCMVIRIVDEELLNATNGIVQGMSGTPILQEGRLVGCVTHVFINDPTKGFADFIDLN